MIRADAKPKCNRKGTQRKQRKQKQEKPPESIFLGSSALNILVEKSGFHSVAEPQPKTLPLMTLIH